MIRALRIVLTTIEWGFAATITVISAVRVTYPDPAQIPFRIRHALVETVHVHYFPIVLFLASGIFISKAGAAILERFGLDRRAVKAVLDAAQEVYFKGTPKEDLHLHRVTLFRARYHLRDCQWIKPWTWQPTPLFWRWQWRRRLSLRMVARSGTNYQRPCVPFWIDNDDQVRNEGVSGQAWFMTGHLVVLDLPEWPANTAEPSAVPECVLYANRCGLALQKAAQLRVKSRSISATVVRKGGAPWGVLVFDSREPQGISNAPEKTQIVELSALTLSQIV